MQSHTSKIVQHPVNESILKLLNELKEVLGEESYSEEILDEFSRELLIFESFQQILNSDNVMWISVSLLNVVNEKIEKIREYLQYFKSSNNESHVDNMMNYTDNVVDLFRGVSISEVDQCAVIKRYVSDIQYAIGKLNTNLHTTSAENIKLENKIKQQKSEIEKLKHNISQNENISRNEINNRIEQLDINLNEFKRRAEEDIDRLKKRNEESITKSLELISEKANDELKNIGIFYKEQEEKFTQLYDKKDNELTKYIDTAKTIVGQVNTTMFSYKYKQVADDAKNREQKWNIICIGALTSSCFAAYFTMIYVTETANANLFWYGAIARTIIIMIALTASGYAGKQAANQGKIERYARKIEMELVAFDTFVENMPEEIKKELKSEVVKRIFINREDIIDEKSDSEKDVSEMFKLILDKLGHLSQGK